MRLRAAAALVPVLCVLAAAPAQAHIVASRLGDFYAGVLHPLTGIEDVALWLAVGVLAGAQGAARGRALVALFPLGLLLGLAAGAYAGAAAVPPVADAALMVLVGGLLALSFALPAGVLWTVGLAIALVRGAANAAGIGPGTSELLFAAGFVLAGYAAITLVMGATVALRVAEIGWRGIAVRAFGSWIAAIGLMVGGYALAGR